MSAFSPPQGGCRSSVVLGYQPSQCLKPASGRDTSLPVYRKNGFIAHLQSVFPDAACRGCTKANGNQQNINRCCTSLEPWRAGEEEGLGMNKGLFLTHRQPLGDSSSPIFFRLCAKGCWNSQRSYTSCPNNASPQQSATTSAAPATSRRHRATWVQACTHSPTPTYQVNILLWYPASFLYTQRKGWQLDFHLGQMSFFNHVTLCPHSSEKPSQ